jgi:hypothetical protein
MKKTTKTIIVLVAIFTIVLTVNSLYKMNVFAQQSTDSTKSEKASTPSISSDIDKTIEAIKNGDSNSGKKQLSTIKDKIEENPDTFIGENHIEDAIQALIDGDNNRAIIHAQEAKILNAKL